MKCCSTCGVEILNDPYLYMDATGESTISNVSIFGSDLVLCPKCTNKLGNYLEELIKYNNRRNIKIMKKQKVININEFRKNLYGKNLF